MNLNLEIGVTVTGYDGNNTSSREMTGKPYQLHRTQDHSDVCWNLHVKDRGEPFGNPDGGYYVRKAVVRKLEPHEIPGYVPKPEIVNNYEVF